MLFATVKLTENEIFLHFNEEFHLSDLEHNRALSILAQFLYYWLEYQSFVRE